MKKTITEVETAIENRIAELEEEYELDIYDRNDIREEEYQKAGWRHDPFPEELEEEDEEEEEDWHSHSIEERLNEVGMSMRDFFSGIPREAPQQRLGLCLVSPVLVWYDMQNRCQMFVYIMAAVLLAIVAFQR